jgi:hypothetical protein
MRRLDDLMPENHRQRLVRQMLNQTLNADGLCLGEEESEQNDPR